MIHVIIVLLITLYKQEDPKGQITIKEHAMVQFDTLLIDTSIVKKEMG